MRSFLDTGTGSGGSVGLDIGVDVLSSAFDGLQGEGEVVLESVHVPVVHTYVLISLVKTFYSLLEKLTAEQSSTKDVTNESGDDTLPDVQPNRDSRSIQPDSHRNKGHVGDNVIESQGHESENRPPDTDNLTGEITTLHTEEAGKTNEPVAADAAQENGLPFGCDLFLGRKGDDFALVGVGAEDFAVSEDDGDHEEGAAQVAEESDEPVNQHFVPRETTLEGRQGGELPSEQSVPRSIFNTYAGDIP